MQGSPSLLTLGLLARDLHLAFAGFVCVVVGLIARACLRSLVGLRVEGRLGPRSLVAIFASSGGGTSGRARILLALLISVVMAKDALPGPAVDCHSGLDCASSRGVMGILGGGGLAASGYGLGWAGLQGAGPRDSRGKRLRRDEFGDDCLGRMKMTLENFGSHLLWPDKNHLVSPAADNMKNMALIEAAYLSARTGMPEQPARILKIA